MSERSDKQSSNAKTIINRPTLSLMNPPDTGSLRPEMGTDSSVLTTIRRIHHLFEDSTNEALIKAIKIIANEPNLDNISSKEIAPRIIHTLLKDSTILLKRFQELGIIEDLLEEERKERRISKPTNHNDPYEKK